MNFPAWVLVVLLVGAVSAFTVWVLVAIEFWAAILYHEIRWHFEKKKRGTR